MLTRSDHCSPDNAVVDTVIIRYMYGSISVLMVLLTHAQNSGYWALLRVWYTKTCTRESADEDSTLHVIPWKSTIFGASAPQIGFRMSCDGCYWYRVWLVDRLQCHVPAARGARKQYYERHAGPVWKIINNNYLCRESDWRDRKRNCCVSQNRSFSVEGGDVSAIRKCAIRV